MSVAQRQSCPGTVKQCQRGAAILCVKILIPSYRTRLHTECNKSVSYVDKDVDESALSLNAFCTNQYSGYTTLAE